MLVFLDIDGVMVPAKSWESPTMLSDGFYQFSDRAVHVLQALLTHDSTVILTSSHKSRFSVDEWKQIFKRRGIHVNNLDRLEENIDCKNRMEELLSWVNKHGIPNQFIVVDDDKSLNALPDFLKDKLVLTSSVVGLTEAHFEEIKSKLDQQLTYASVRP